MLNASTADATDDVQAVQQATAAAAGTTTINPATGLATVSQVGQSAAITAAANDNATLAASIAQSLAQQTAELKIPPDRVALFTSAQMAASVPQAFTGLEGRSGTNGATTFTVKPVVDQMASDNRVIIAQNQQMIDLQIEGLRALKGAGTLNPQTGDRGQFGFARGSLRNA